MGKKEVADTGYDDEERYFRQQEVELLKKKRAEIEAARRAGEAEQRKQAHWMRCPKCGEGLEEIEMDSIMVDRCTGCGGVFFDKGEVELLLETHKGGIRARLKRLLK